MPLTVVMAGARHFTQLIIWRIADDMRQRIFALTRQPGFARDFRLRSQLDDAIDSVCRNSAEGFGGESHADFAHYLKIARKSLNEVMDCLHSSQLKGHVTAEELRPIRLLSHRLFPAIAGMLRHLESTADDGSPQRPNRRRRRTNGDR